MTGSAVSGPDLTALKSIKMASLPANHHVSRMTGPRWYGLSGASPSQQRRVDALQFLAVWTSLVGGDEHGVHAVELGPVGHLGQGVFGGLFVEALAPLLSEVSEEASCRSSTVPWEMPWWSMTGMTWASTATDRRPRPRMVSRRSDCTPQRMAVWMGQSASPMARPFSSRQSQHLGMPRLPANAGPGDAGQPFTSPGSTSRCGPRHR